MRLSQIYLPHKKAECNITIERMCRQLAEWTPPILVDQRSGPYSSWKRALRHLVYPSTNFYRSKKGRNLASISTPVTFVSPSFWNGTKYLKSKTVMMGAQWWLAMSPHQIWYSSVHSTAKSRGYKPPQKRAGKSCWIINSISQRLCWNLVGWSSASWLKPSIIEMYSVSQKK